MKRFRVAISYPGERRPFVERLAARLADKLGRDGVLYDKFHEAEFARPDLDTYLQRLYHDQSMLLVVFICEEYEQKEWCGLEWRAVRDIIKRRSAETVMLLRFDMTEVPGLFSIDGYVWIGDRAADEVGDVVLQRLAIVETGILSSKPDGDCTARSAITAPEDEQSVEPPLPPHTKPSRPRWLLPTRVVLLAMAVGWGSWQAWLSAPRQLVGLRGPDDDPESDRVYKVLMGDASFDDEPLEHFIYEVPRDQEFVCKGYSVSGDVKVVLIKRDRQGTGEGDGTTLTLGRSESCGYQKGQGLVIGSSERLVLRSLTGAGTYHYEFDGYLRPATGDNP